MVDINVIDRVETQYTTTGAAEAVRSAERVSLAHDGIAGATDRSAKASLSAESALNKLQLKYDEEYRKTQQLEKAHLGLAKAREQGLISRAKELELAALAEKRILGEVEKVNLLTEAKERLNRVSEVGASFLGGGLLGGAAGLLGITAVVELGKAIKETTKEAEELDSVSQRLGMSTDTLQELAFAAKSENLEFGELRGALDKFNVAIGQAARGSGELLPILKANGIAVKDQRGNQLPLNDLLHKYADLVKNAASEEDRAVLLRVAYGRTGMELNDIMKDGSKGLDDYAKKAHDMGAVIKEDLVKNTADLDKVFNQYTSALTAALKGALYEFLTWLKSVTGEMDTQADIVQRVQNMAGGALAGGAVGLVAGGPVGGVIGLGIGTFAGANVPIPHSSAAANDNAFRWPGDAGGGVNKMAQGTDTGSYDTSWMHSKTTIMPSVPVPPNAFETAFKSSQKQLDGLKAQAVAYGMTTDAAAAYLKKQELINVAAENNIKLTPKQKDEIDKLADEYGKATKKLEDFRAVQEASLFISQGIFDAFSAWIDGTDSLAHSMQNLAKQILQAALQATLLGQGPLAGLFGTSGPSGGLLTTLVQGAASVLGFGGGKAEGGPIEAGKWYIAGEHGPEPIWGGGPGAYASGYGRPAANDNRGGNFNVTVVNNHPDAEISTQQKTGSDGSRHLEIMVEKIVNKNIASGKHDAVLSARTGGQRPTARYA
jgi:hypothetical protein